MTSGALDGSGMNIGLPLTTMAPKNGHRLPRKTEGPWTKGVNSRIGIKELPLLSRRFYQMICSVSRSLDTSVILPAPLAHRRGDSVKTSEAERAAD